MDSAWAGKRFRDHPIAFATSRDGEQCLDGQPVLTATDLSSLTGRGVQARVNGEMVLIGKAEMFGRDGFAALSAETVRTIERSEEHTSELQSLMRISYAVFCLKKKKKINRRIKLACNMTQLKNRTGSNDTLNVETKNVNQ